MAISNLSGNGKMPENGNKLYLINISTQVSSKDVNFFFYSTQKIDTKAKFMSFLENFKSYSLGVFGDNYSYQHEPVINPVKARWYSDNFFSLYYYDTTISQWTASQISNISVHCQEV